jgi:hypothetical protein
MTFTLLSLTFILSPAHAAEPPKTGKDKAKGAIEEQADPERFKKFEAYQEKLESKFRQYQKLHGNDLKKAGWKEIARCDDGHTWSYILEKQNDFFKCEGINAFAGPEEHPCVPFTGDIEKFKAFAAKKAERDCWNAPR